MEKTLFRLLIVNKEALAPAMAAAFQSGASPNALMLTVEEKLYTAYDVPSDIQSVQHVLNTYSKSPFGDSGYTGRALSPGDLILGSNGQALVLAGEGDFNDVTGKVAAYVDFPKTSTPVAMADAEDEDEEEEAEEDEVDGEDDEEGTVKAAPAAVGRSLRVGAIANPRNVERKELQALMTDAIGEMFEKQNIPLNRHHSRRAIRASMRIGIRLALEEGQNLGSLMQLFAECISKESKELGKKTGKMHVAMVQIDED